jgi:VanZ family protein
VPPRIAAIARDAFPGGHRRLWRSALGVCMLVILVLSLLPPTGLPTTGWDKSNHVLAFAVLAFLSHGAWPGRTVVALAGLLGYGGLIEVLQSFTPGRSADFADLVADAIGLASGALLTKAFSHWLTRARAR